MIAGLAPFLAFDWVVHVVCVGHPQGNRALVSIRKGFEQSEMVTLSCRCAGWKESFGFRQMGAAVAIVASCPSDLAPTE